MSRLWIGLALVLCLGTYSLGADPPGQKLPTPVNLSRPSAAQQEKGDQQQTRQVLRLRNVPATQLASVINNLFGAEQRTGRSDAASHAVIVPDTISNCLVVSGSADAVTVVQKLVAQLDRAPVMIRLEVVMGDVPAAKTESEVLAANSGEKAHPAKIHASAVGAEEVRKQMEVLFQAQVTTLDNQPAFLQLGRNEPTIAGVNISQMGRSNSITMQNVGTKVSLTPRADIDGRVTMQLDIEDSRLAPADEGVAIFTPSKGEPLRTPATDRLSVQTTVKIANGQTMVLSGMTQQSKSGKQRVILVTPHVLPIGGEAKPEK